MMIRNYSNNKLEEWQKRILLYLYPGYDKIIGPYQVKKGRLIITFYNSYLPKTDKRKSRTFVYPRVMVESYLGERLSNHITVDHIDHNFLNNDLSNLALVIRKIHTKNDSTNVKIKPINCPLCNKIFTPSPKQAYPKLDLLGTPGPFCPECVNDNKYINYIKSGGIPIQRVKLEREYYKIEKIYEDELVSNIILKKMNVIGCDHFVIPDLTKIFYQCKICGNQSKDLIVYCSNLCLDIDLKVSKQFTVNQRNGIPTKEELEELLKKMTLNKISQLFNVHYRTVAVWAQNYNIEYDHHQVKHNGRSVKPDLEKIKSLMKLNYSYRKIYEILREETPGLTKNIIENTIRRKKLREVVNINII